VKRRLKHPVFALQRRADDVLFKKAVARPALNIGTGHHG
jgi:hypothetical protein